MPTYLHHDQLGSTRLLTNSSGEATGTFSYRPYGALIASTGEQATTLGYAGEYANSQSGLLDLRARAYDPASGQFLSRDPLVIATRQPYSYAADNPVNARDPSGLEAIAEVAGGADGICAGTWEIPGVDIITCGGAAAATGAAAGAAISNAMNGEAEAEGSQDANSQACDDLRNSGDQDALIKAGREAKRRGVSPEEAEILREWAEEYDVPFRGPEAHPGRGAGGAAPHIHLGPINHIPVR